MLHHHVQDKQSRITAKKRQLKRKYIIAINFCFSDMIMNENNLISRDLMYSFFMLYYLVSSIYAAPFSSAVRI